MCYTPSEDVLPFEIILNTGLANLLLRNSIVSRLHSQIKYSAVVVFCVLCFVIGRPYGVWCCGLPIAFCVTVTFDKSTPNKSTCKL